jgi:hypothetical protein
MLVDVEVEYFDQGTGALGIEMTAGPECAFNGAYTASKTTITSGEFRFAENCARPPHLLKGILNSQNRRRGFSHRHGHARLVEAGGR